MALKCVELKSPLCLCESLQIRVPPKKHWLQSAMAKNSHPLTFAAGYLYHGCRKTKLMAC